MRTTFHSEFLSLYWNISCTSLLSNFCNVSEAPGLTGGTDRRCSASDLTQEDLDHLQTELSKVRQRFGRSLTTVCSRNTQRRRFVGFSSTCSPFFLLHRWKMKFRLCDSSWWSKKRMPLTSGGGWAWAPSVTSSRTWPRAGTRSRPHPREFWVCTCTLALLDGPSPPLCVCVTPVTASCLVSDSSQPRPLWTTLATPTCECLP